MSTNVGDHFRCIGTGAAQLRLLLVAATSLLVAGTATTADEAPGPTPVQVGYVYQASEPEIVEELQVTFDVRATEFASRVVPLEVYAANPEPDGGPLAGALLYSTSLLLEADATLEPGDVWIGTPDQPLIWKTVSVLPAIHLEAGASILVVFHTTLESLGSGAVDLRWTLVPAAASSTLRSLDQGLSWGLLTVSELFARSRQSESKNTGTVVHILVRPVTRQPAPTS